MIEVLRRNHPAERIPEYQFLESYGGTPLMLRLDITSEMIHNVAWWMFWDAGMGVVGGSQLRLCLLCYSDAIAELREAYATLSAWLEST